MHLAAQVNLFICAAHKAIYYNVVYDPSSRKIVDFLSILNPLIARGINEPDIS